MFDCLLALVDVGDVLWFLCCVWCGHLAWFGTLCTVVLIRFCVVVFCLTWWF